MFPATKDYQQATRLDARAMTHPYAPSTSVPTMQQGLGNVPPLHQFYCRYRSKICLNVRARKRDGSLHRYCEEHRQRANTNQKKWAQRRMEALDECEQPVIVAEPSNQLPLRVSSPANTPPSSLHTNEEPISPLFADESEYELLWQALGAIASTNDHDVYDGQ